MRWSDSVKLFVIKGAIRYHQRLYYLGTPEVSDNTYDMLIRELQSLERRNPNLVTDDSPTQVPGR